MKQPDAFERAVAMQVGSYDKQELLNAGEAVALLRSQHNKVRRLVQRTAGVYGDMGTPRAIKNDILAALDRMRKGVKT